MDKWLRYIGIAAKAGHLKGGELQTEKAVQNGSAALVILAEDASDNTKKKVSALCGKRNTPLITGGSKENLGILAGKDLRSTLVITDRGLADAVMTAYAGNKSNDGGDADGSKDQSS